MAAYVEQQAPDPDELSALLANGGFPWTIVHLEGRSRYMSALEAASVENDIKPFAAFIREEMNRRG